MLNLFIFLLALTPAAALGQTYLVEPSQAACLARSATQCTALGCDGVQTKYWWACQVLATATATGGSSGSGGTTAIQIAPGDRYFDVTTTNAKVATPTGLSSAEQAAVQTVTQLGTALPYIVATPNFTANFTSAQKTAITGNVTYATEWTTINGGALVNLTNPALLSWMSSLVAAGIITQANYQTIMTRTAVLVAP